MATRKSAKKESATSERDSFCHSKARFNLIDEKWLPVVWKQEATGLSGLTGAGTRPAEVGLRDTLLYAHEIGEVADQSPLVTAALHRLLIALVHSIYRGPDKRKDWATMWQAGSFDQERLRGYFEKWQDRFWLFHPKRPFLQCMGEDLGNPVPITLLNMALASTGDATLFDHSLDAAHPGLTCPEATRELMAFLTFKTGGFVEGVPGERAKASALAAPWADGAAFLAMGQSLFGTLMMNLMLPDSRNRTVFELGEPEWERSESSPRTPPKQGEHAGAPQSYLSFLTAPCRHLLLSEPDALGLVRGLRLQLGTVFSASAPVDPAKAYYVDKKLGWRPLALRADRALWRDSAVLFEISSEERATAAALGQLASLREHEVIPIDLVVGLRAFGTIGSQAKLDLWRAETLPIPVDILGNPGRRSLIEDCLDLAEEAEKALRAATWALVSHLVPKSKEEKDRTSLRDHLDVTRPFWTALETTFKQYVLLSPPSVHPEAVRRQWADCCMTLARHVLVKALDGLSGSGKTLQATAEAERTLFKHLQDIRKNHNLAKETKDVGTTKI